MLQANEVLGEDVFHLEDWRVIGEYVFDGQGGRHQAFYAALREVLFNNIRFGPGERVQVEQSLKYSSEEAGDLWKSSGLASIDRWTASSDAYSKYCTTAFLLLSPRPINACQVYPDVGVTLYHARSNNLSFVDEG